MTPDQSAPVSSKVPEAPEKPEILGTVISAPVTAQSPADITRKNKPAGKVKKPENKEPTPEDPDMTPAKESHQAKRPGVRAPVRPVHVGVPAPEKEKVEALGSGPKKAEKAPEVIPMGAPKPKSDEAIPLKAPKPRSDEAIQLGAPKPKSDEAIPMSAPKPDAPVKPIHLGAPVSEKDDE
jgi:hypothetical protein